MNAPRPAGQTTSFLLNRPLILIGMKGSGKTTVGRLLAEQLRLPFIDVDEALVHRSGETLSPREIFQKHGADEFRRLEAATLAELAGQSAVSVLATGGGLPLTAANRPLLRALGTIVFLDVDESVLLDRILAGGVPPFFPYQDDPHQSLRHLLAERRPIYRALADLTLALALESPEEIVDLILDRLPRRA